MPIKPLGISPHRLMDESECFIHRVHLATDDAQRSIVESLFDNPGTYGQWESGHYRIMKTVASDLRADAQTRRLRETCFALTHQKALFEYLRDHRVRGDDRVAVIDAFHGTLDYRHAVIAEHGRFLRSTWSFLCAGHLVEALMKDALFEQQLAEYQSAFAEYFAVYCGRVIAESRQSDYALAPLLGHLKRRTAQLRHQLLELPLPVKPRRRNRRGSSPATSARRRRPVLPYSY